MKEHTESAILEEMDREEQERERQFLKSWKVAVKRPGPALFAVKSSSVDAATHKNKLRPDLKVDDADRWIPKLPDYKYLPDAQRKFLFTLIENHEPW